MPRKSPYVVRLTKKEARELEKKAGKYALLYFQVQRARMILRAAQGHSNDAIAHYLHTTRDVVSRWRKRFFEHRLAGRGDRQRPGRPRVPPPRRGGPGQGSGL